MKKALLSTLAVATCVLSQGAFAHTGVEVNTLLEGSGNVYNAMTVTHGCATNANGEGSPLTPANLNVLASSTVFPNGANPVVNIVNADGSDGAQIDLTTVIQGTVGGAFTNLSPSPIFPGMFPFEKVVMDSLGNQRGVHAWGNPNNTPFFPVTHAVGLEPFRMANVQFVRDAPGAINCATALKVRFAAAEWCQKGKTGIGTGTNADIWIGHMTTKFNDVYAMPYNATAAAAGSFYWPTMTINRDLVNHPLDPSCGAGYAVAIAPNDADIDAYLGITKSEVPAGFWPNN